MLFILEKVLICGVIHLKVIKMRILGLLLYCVFSIHFLYGQHYFDLKVQNNKVSYNVGDSIYLDLIITEKSLNDFDNQLIVIETYKEGTDSISRLQVKLKKGVNSIIVKGPSDPQVFRIKAVASVHGKKVEEKLGLAFDEDRLVSTSRRPTDFVNFWENQLASLKDVPLDAQLRYDSTLSTDSVAVYQVSYQVDKSSSRFFGVLNIPKFLPKGAKCPAIVIYPGAGVRGYGAENRYAKLGFITLQVGVHGLPIDLPKEVYTNMAKASLSGYQFYNLLTRENYYFNRVIKGAVRALDFIESLKEYDGKDLFVMGSSQGGALSLIVTSLDNRVKAVAAYCPALCQTSGSLFGQAEGWPQPMKKLKEENPRLIDDAQLSIPYYDVANFISLINVPVFMTWGLIDDVTPASTIFGAYNQLETVKSKFILPNIAHANDRSQILQVQNFILNNGSREKQ